MKKISLKNVLTSLTRDEMKKIMAGSGQGCESIPNCNPMASPGQGDACCQGRYCDTWNGNICVYIGG